MGSAVTCKLRELGFDNLVLRTREDMDLADARAVEDFVADQQPEYVIHAAARVGGIQANIADPVGFLVENLDVNTSVIRACLRCGVRNLVYIGSSCMYPRDYKTPLREEYILAAPLEPTNEGYALAKIAGAKLCEYCNRQYGTNYKTLIPCNLYGPGDKFGPDSSHLIAAIIDKIHAAKTAGARTVEIWGDGRARREFLYVDDLAEYVCACLAFLDKLPVYLNVGYGRDYTVLDYYRMAAEVMGFEGEFVFDKSKPIGMTVKLLDSTRARGHGWNPHTTPRDGIARTYEYYLRDVIGCSAVGGRSSR